MITCTVHESPNPPAVLLDRAEKLVFVRDGFRWTAFLLTPIWLLAKRLWLPFLAFLAVMIGLGLATRGLGGAQQWAGYAAFAVQLIVGYEAASLERWKLDRRGWRMIGAVSGRNREDCERRFFSAWLAETPSARPPASQPPPVAGLFAPLRAFSRRA